MSRGSPHRRDSATSTDDARDRILVAAERCIDRHGIRKTTMEDIAAEVAMSRPSVYRYFADRDDLFIELIARHSGALRARAHKRIAQHSSLPEQIVEGLIFLADHGRRDPLMRHLIDPDGKSLGQRLVASRTSELLMVEFWDPFMDAAYANNELPRGLPRADVYLWMGNLGLMLMRGLEEGEGDLKRYRSILEHFVAPAFAGANRLPGT
jgi:AcrR family transcriptional regulator